jgi:DNA-binding MarR family transcriptional regulator
LSKISRAELVRNFVDAVRASQTANQTLDSLVGEYLGLDSSAYRCLDILDQDGPMTAGQLAGRARLSPGAITAVVDRLEDKGLARRTRDTSDRRRVLVEVTPLAREGAEELYGTPGDGAQALAGYSDEELQFLIRFLQGSVAYQEERMRRLDQLKARDTERGSR